MKNGIGCLIVVLCLGCMVGCCSDQPKQEVPEQSGATITSENFNRIVGMQWILKKMTIDGVEYQLAREKPFMKFGANGKLNGHASVNRFFGSMEVDADGKLKWSKAFGSTRMAGPENMMKQESAFLKTLPMTEQASLDKIFLTFQTKDGKTELIFYVPVE